ncbi:hypothetical protein LEP1GSC058_0185 [Leptospira fainei serovar Hurstbridge str. BUT 6]|uniref:Uncharacterized protein n=1 Tax=Leptospira fainei serovar Hurstbridge str. BUT 6 TaxID=1193011 RepID=S3UZW5_9LEPT|nr:hypothetical protein [Leptospira fainei]EPG74768.1 hypothetical protein LEP1GSC058_0185 [Leptospira fainei serovar Hurstbridge str. BUT 6]
MNLDHETIRKMNECHSWILKKGTIIHIEGIPYYLSADTEILGNTEPIKFPPLTEDDLERFLNTDLEELE